MDTSHLIFAVGIDSLLERVRADPFQMLAKALAVPPRGQIEIDNRLDHLRNIVLGKGRANDPADRPVLAGATPKRDLEVLDLFLVDAENAYIGGSGINRLCSAPLMRHFHLFATTARDCYIAATQSGCALARSSRQEPA